MARRGRPPHPGPLTPAEERVLACVREGMPNAAIAVRLGVSVNTVRYHVSNLLAKAGAASREDLGRWRPRGGGGRRSWGWFGWLAARPVALVVGLVAVASVGVFFFVPLPAAEEAEPVELPEPFTRPDADELRAQGFVDVGPLLEVEGRGDVVLGHSMRDLFSVVLLSGPAQFVEQDGDDLAPIVRYDDFGSSASVGRSREVVTSEGAFVIWVQSLSSDPRENPIRVSGAIRPTVSVHAESGDGAFVHTATATPDGHVWVDPQPLDRSAVYDAWTGEKLDTSGARELGSLAVNRASTDFHFTGCEDGLCYVSYRLLSTSLSVPSDGNVQICPTARDEETGLQVGAFSLYTPFVALSFAGRNTNFGAWPDDRCNFQWTVRGEYMAPPGHYVGTAFDPLNRKLSLGISLDGHLYAGDFAPTGGCPCRHGN